jgi:uncharacterized repeat protein (TIGR03803 family)
MSRKQCFVTTPVLVRVLAALVLSLILASGALAQSQQVLYSLGAVPGDGAGPMAGLVMDPGGNLYGTTALGLGHGLDRFASGSVFKLVRKPGGGWTENVLHTFSGKDGAVPTGTLLLAEPGTLYGTTTQGGAHNAGVVFKLVRSASGWKEQVLYNFTGLSDGCFPYAGVISDAAGNLYGTTELGGLNRGGTAFELTHGPTGWTEKVLHNFGFTGKTPFGGLIFDAAGNLYGTTKFGGTADNGVVYKLTPGSNGSWTATVLYSFLGVAENGTDGKSPYGSLVFDSQGRLYGTTKIGGLFNGGIIFQLTPSRGAGWTERVLHYGNDRQGGGYKFLGSLVFDTAGRLYGTAAAGGTFNWGVVFRLTPTPNSLWKDAVLYVFSGGNDGGSPMAGVALDAHGNIFGTTYTGGNAGNGTAFEITP